MGRTRLEQPSNRRFDEYSSAIRASRRLYGHFARPSADREVYDAWLEHLAQPRHEGHFVIATESDTIAGIININEIVRGSFQSAYLGYFAVELHAGKGHMTAGLALVLPRAFGQLGLHRLEANIQPDNVASLALIRRAGFTCEGFSPRYLKIAGRWRDHERWALLREDWRAGKAPATSGSNPGPQAGKQR